MQGLQAQQAVRLRPRTMACLLAICGEILASGIKRRKPAETAEPILLHLTTWLAVVAQEKQKGIFLPGTPCMMGETSAIFPGTHKTHTQYADRSVRYFRHCANYSSTSTSLPFFGPAAFIKSASTPALGKKWCPIIGPRCPCLPATEDEEGPLPVMALSPFLAW